MSEWEVILTHLTDKDKISLILTCKHFANYFRYILTGVKDIQLLESKYSRYKTELDGCTFFIKEMKEVAERSIAAGVALYDMLSTACTLPFASHSMHSFTPQIEGDIKRYLELKPRSITFCIGQLRCRNYVSPLMMACHNEKIPIHIIRLLLAAGANPNTFINVTGQPKHILEDAKQYPDRHKEISALFSEYGLDLSTEPPKTPLECMERLMI